MRFLDTEWSVRSALSEIQDAIDLMDGPVDKKLRPLTVISAIEQKKGCSKPQTIVSALEKVRGHLVAAKYLLSEIVSVRGDENYD